MRGEIPKNINNWLTNIKIYENFIKSYIALPGQWLAYPLEPEAFSTLDAVTKINKINLTIWQRDQESSRTLHCVYKRTHDHNYTEHHLLHTHAADCQRTTELNHFIRLQVQSIEPCQHPCIEDQVPSVLFVGPQIGSPKIKSPKIKPKAGKQVENTLPINSKSSAYYGSKP